MECRASRAWFIARDEHVRRETLDLRVELESCDHVTGTCDLEVHVAEVILDTEDVRQR